MAQFATSPLSSYEAGTLLGSVGYWSRIDIVVINNKQLVELVSVQNQYIHCVSAIIDNFQNATHPPEKMGGM